MARYGNEAGGTGASKGVLNVNIEMLARPGKTTTRGMVAMQKNKKGMGRTAKTGRPVDSCPKFRRKRGGKNRINCGWKFVL